MTKAARVDWNLREGVFHVDQAARALVRGDCTAAREHVKTARMYSRTAERIAGRAAPATRRRVDGFRIRSMLLEDRMARACGGALSGWRK